MQTLEDLKDRCSIDEGECWIWKGCLARGLPRIWDMDKGRTSSAGPLIYKLTTGKEIPKGRFYFVTCGNLLCVNPEHRKLGTRSWMWKHHRPNRSQEEIARITAGHRKISKVTPEIAEEIRSADGTNVEIGERFGVHFCTVWRIKTGRRGGDAIAGASVFAWRP